VNKRFSKPVVPSTCHRYNLHAEFYKSLVSATCITRHICCFLHVESSTCRAVQSTGRHCALWAINYRQIHVKACITRNLS